MSVIIVGGGIGGLAAALAIARTGRSVQVLEQAPRFEEIGAGIQLGPNATAVLDDLGVFESLRDVAVYPRRLVLMNAVGGAEITEVDLGQSFLDHYGHPYVVLHRADLLAALLDATEREPLITLEADREVVAVSQHADGVQVECRDGTSYEEAEGVVGADGIHSFVRRTIVDDVPEYTSEVAFRGVAPLSEIPELRDLAEVLMWIGPGFHFVQYPLRGGELLNQVAVFNTLSVGGQAARSSAALQGMFEERFSVACPRVHRDLQHVARDRHWEMQARAPLDRWTDGRVTLLGDAAHAMLQYIAQGACQAFEDASSLGSAFARSDDVEQAFLDYGTSRSARTERVQKAARQWGEICHLDGIAAKLRDRLLGAREGSDYGEIDWLYGYRSEQLRAPAVAAVPD